MFTGTPDDGMTLHAVESIPGGSRPSPIEGCDLDRDLRTDLVLGNSGNARVSVYRGTEAPEFIQSWQELTAANGVRAVAVLDADQDGDDDVLAAAREDNRLVLFLNDGTGTLASAGTFEGGNQESGLAVADANRDGILDVYVGTFGGRTVSLLLGDGDGGFRMSDTQAVPGNSWMLAPGDMNGDGYADVVSVNSAGNSVSVILTDGRGGLYPAESYHPGVFPLAVDVGDLDGDGDLDVVTSNWASADWPVYSNFGDGSLSLLRRLDASSAGSCAVLHDRNGDGTLDITGIDEADDLIFLFRTEPLAPPPPGGSFPPPFPNPFSDVANVRFALEASGPVQIRIYDLRGRLVRGLHDGEMPAGGHRVRWDGTDARGMPVPAGVYLVRLSTRTRSESRRVVKLP